MQPLRHKTLRHENSTLRTTKVARSASRSTTPQILSALALGAILMVGSGITTGMLGFVMLLVCSGVGIFLVRNSLKHDHS